MIFNKDYETIKRQDLDQLQIERLQSTLNRVYRNVAFYKQIFDTNNINIEKIKSINDLCSLPFTTKENLRKSYPYDMFAVPLRDIVRIHATSGTTGKAVIVGYTKNDLKMWTECTARVLSSVGITPHDVVQIAYNYSLFTGGFGFHQGAECIGASVIPSSFTNMPERQITLMKDFKSTALICSPSYALQLAYALEEMSVHPETLFLKIGLLGAEPWSEKLRSYLDEKLHLISYDNYGLTEIIGPGVAGECEKRNGLHINEDHFIVEVIDPKSLQPLEPGQEGELVFTTITKEGFPLIRYRTGDVSSLIPEPCPCGRTLMRMKRVTDRTDDLIFYKELKIFPSQIEDVLHKIEGTAPHYQLILEREEGVEKIELKVEISEDLPSIDELKTLERLRTTITGRLEQELGLQAKVTLAEPKSLRSTVQGKKQRVIDKRKL
jgi:phenylacetate-CoA ligase